MQELTPKEKFTNMLMKDDGAEKLFKSWQSREIDEAFPGLFPDKPGREAAALQEYLKNFDKIPDRIDYRLALLFLCLNGKKAAAAAQNLEIEEETKHKVCETIRLREEFYFIDSIYKVKRFMIHHGEEMFHFLQKVSELQIILHDHPELRDLGRAEYFKLIKESGDPVYMEDMQVDAAKLREAGVPEEKIPQTMNALLDYIHKFPQCNVESILIQKARNINSSFGVKLLKKLRSKY